MAQEIYIYADFHYLKEIELIGILSYERIRGNDSYGFDFAKEWLLKYGNTPISYDLQNFPGKQYTQLERDIFGCFSDALPDRWGRTLLMRREQIEAAQEGRLPRKLTTYDLLLGIDDFSRMGGFRFKRSQNGDFINTQPSFRIPPIANIRSLIDASKEIERCEAKSTLPEKRWIEQLILPCSSLGGARPKANVVDEQGLLHIAKFPSLKDDLDIGGWEHFAHILAEEAGINSAKTRLLPTNSNHHTLLSRRFDRIDNSKRIHFASALTLLGLSDGDNASTGNGYLDIVDFIIQGCTDVEMNLQELYRRVAFNICIGNSDDHFRNHGFLLTPKGWTLSPAYDINPTLNRHQSLLVTSSSNEADLALLASANGDYLISKSDSERIIKQVKDAVKNWRSIATRLKLSNQEMEYFAQRFDNL